MEHKIYQKFIEALGKTYPKAASQSHSFQIKPQLISPFILPTPQQIFQDVEAFRQCFYEIVESKAYQDSILKNSPWETQPHTPSAFTCFDFHYSEETGLKLIEVNTNASLFLPFQILKDLHQVQSPSPCKPELFWQDFVDTNRLIFQTDPQSIVILDEDPAKEGLYFEFLLLKELFENKGIPTEIHSLASYETLELTGALVYNRYTDFYLEQERSQKLKHDYQTGAIAMTPHPRAYALMADKNRLRTLRELMTNKNEALATMIPESRSFGDYASIEEVWSQRKNLFFKPQNAFGGKGAFRGKSISKTMFETLAPADYLAQELCPPGKASFTYEEQTLEMKYDLRFYVSPRGLIDAGARLYQGQTTNMRTDFGGIAPVSIL